MIAVSICFNRWLLFYAGENTKKSLEEMVRDQLDFLNFFAVFHFSSLYLLIVDVLVLLSSLSCKLNLMIR